MEPVIGHLKAEHRMGHNYSPSAPVMRLMPCWPQLATTSGCVGPGLAALLRLLLGDTPRNVARDTNPMGVRALIATATQIPIRILHGRPGAVIN